LVFRIDSTSVAAVAADECESVQIWKLPERNHDKNHYNITVHLDLYGLSDVAAAEELWVITDDVLDKEPLTPEAAEVAKDHVG